MSDTIIAFISGIISGAFVAGISSCIANIFSERRDRRKEFNNAAKEFRASFTDEIKLLKRHCFGDESGNITVHILADAIEKHESAMINFRPHLNRADRCDFDNAWRNYAFVENDAGWNMTPDKAINKYYSYEKTLLEYYMRKLAIARIKLLLTFANPK